MAGRCRAWLAVGVVAVLVVIALWWYPPAARVEALMTARGGAGQVSHSANVPAAEVAPSHRGSPIQASQVKAFEDLKQRAKAGDALAQRLLADAYEACFVVNLDREGFLRGLDFNRRMIRAPAELAVLEQVARERYEQCGAVDDGAIIPLDMIRGWYAQAAENGDLPARLMDNAFNHREQDTKASVALLEEVLASNDPAAVFAMGSTLGRNYPSATGDPVDALMTGERASTAWMVAACRMGYDCEPSGILMGTLCLGVNGCTGEDFETYVKRELGSDADRRDLERRVTEILRLVEGQ